MASPSLKAAFKELNCAICKSNGMAPIVLPQEKNAFVSADKRQWKSMRGPIEMPDGVQYDMQWHEISYNGKILRSTVSIFGPRPSDGYPLYFGLHGGGSRLDGKSEHDSELTNNESWYTLVTSWYLETVKNFPSAMYIAPRGVANSWDMHFRPESHVLFESLIKSLLIPIEETDRKPLVNSNKVYLAGFSAGGDAVYRLSTNMPDAFAAVNMSADHPGDVAFDNLANLPICLQVGENDRAHDRVEKTVNSNTKLTELENTMPSHYTHECYIHLNGDHADWSEAEYGEAEVRVLTGRLHVRRQYEDNDRNPIPNRLVWNLNSWPPTPDNVENWKPKRYFYWLYLIDPNVKLNDPNKTTIRAEYHNKTNTIHIEEPNAYIGIFLKESMVHFERRITIVMGRKSVNGGTSVITLEADKITSNTDIMRTTYGARGDKAFEFTAMLRFELNPNNAWEVKVASNLSED